MVVDRVYRIWMWAALAKLWIAAYTTKVSKFVTLLTHASTGRAARISRLMSLEVAVHTSLRRSGGWWECGKTPLWLIILSVSRVLSEVLSWRRPIITMITVTLGTGCDVSMVIDIVKAFMSPTLHHSCLLVSCLCGTGDCQQPIEFQIRLSQRVDGEAASTNTFICGYLQNLFSVDLDQSHFLQCLATQERRDIWQVNNQEINLKLFLTSRIDNI